MSTTVTFFDCYAKRVVLVSHMQTELMGSQTWLHGKPRRRCDYHHSGVDRIVHIRTINLGSRAVCRLRPPAQTTPAANQPGMQVFLATARRASLLVESRSPAASEWPTSRQGSDIG